MFFSFDGIDGSGKSTQIGLFSDWLRRQGHETIVCRDPGSTKLGEEIRKLLLNRDDLAISRRAEMLLYMAARAQLVEEVIAPALASGKTVVCDRFLLANVVYQGYAGGLDVPSLWQVGQVATGGLEPDLTFVLDIDDARAAQRMNRPLDRMERQGDAFRASLRAGYLAEAGRRADRMVVIDASRSIEEVQAEIRRTAELQLRTHWRLDRVEASINHDERLRMAVQYTGDFEGSQMKTDIAIVDKGRGPQLCTSRITVQDLVP